MAAAERDPGLQPERTRLAWRRTTLSCTVVAILAGKQALHDGTSPAAVIVMGLCGLAWLGFLLVAHLRVTAMEMARPQPMSPRGALAVTACTVALAVFAAAMLFQG